MSDDTSPIEQLLHLFDDLMARGQMRLEREDEERLQPIVAALWAAVHPGAPIIQISPEQLEAMRAEADDKGKYPQ